MSHRKAAGAFLAGVLSLAVGISLLLRLTSGSDGSIAPASIVLFAVAVGAIAVGLCLLAYGVGGAGSVLDGMD